jgi:hypothetical protein
VIGKGILSIRAGKSAHGSGPSEQVITGAASSDEPAGSVSAGIPRQGQFAEDPTCSTDEQIRQAPVEGEAPADTRRRRVAAGTNQPAVL